MISGVLAPPARECARSSQLCRIVRQQSTQKGTVAAHRRRIAPPSRATIRFVSVPPAPDPRATGIRFIGVDLAWGEGSPTKRPRETGLAAIDATGTVLDAGWARGIDDVAAWVLSMVLPGSIVAIDAPLVVENPTGMRLAERQVGMGYGRWKVAANASNQALGWQGGVTLRRLLEASGLRYTDGLTPADPTARSMFECYPYTTIVGMEELGYTVERPRYKRMVKGLPTAEARAVRAAACDELIARMRMLDTADPPLQLASHPLTRTLLDEPSPISDVPYKHREDLLDALLCAWTASIWHRHGFGRAQVLGDTDAPDSDGRRPTIVAPARPEQRVEGRAMRPLKRHELIMSGTAPPRNARV